MINKADILDRLRALVGKELTIQNLHKALFCEDKDWKRLRRFNSGTHTYLEYKVHIDSNSNKPPFTVIKVLGNPNTFRMDLEEKEDKIIICSEPKINYSYI
jgi:hypothetical protein